MKCSGVFELHNTIACHNKKDEERFEEICNKYKLKPIKVLILYDRRYKSEKNMLATKWKRTTDSSFDSFDTRFLLQTSKYIAGDLQRAMEELEQVTKLLTEENFDVIREKIEAVRSTVVMDYLSVECYYETHIVVTVADFVENTL